MDELDRLYRRTVQNIRNAFPELLTRGFEVSQLYQQIVPYRTNRRELALHSSDEYELAVMQLLAGLRGYLQGDVELQKAMRTELASPNPDLTAFRVFASSTVLLAPEALRALERLPPGGDQSPTAASSRSPSELAALAGRATEAVEVSSEHPHVRATPRAARPPGAPAAAEPSMRAEDAGRGAAEARDVPAGDVAVRAPALDPAPSPSGRGSARGAAAGRPLPPRVPTPASPPRPLPASARADGPRPPLDPPMAAPRSAPPAVSAGESCRYCSGVLPDGRRVTYCPTCGHNLTVQHCPACATELEVEWKFCITCGRGVAESDARPMAGELRRE